MPNRTFSQVCACLCGASQVVVNARPRARYVCHCTICQAVYRKSYADITALRAEDVTLREGHKIQFKEYRSPPAVSRGTCSSCGCPVVGFLSPVPFVRIAFVPAEIYPDQMVLSPPRMYIFYHRRRTDVSDTIPKYSGEWRSQLAAGLYIMFSMFRWSTRKKQDDHD
jgi:hypothetical protein